MTKLILIIILLIIVVLILKKYFPKIFEQILEITKDTKKQENKPIYGYKCKDFLMTKSEHEFFDILIDIAGDQYYIFPQIHLSTFLDNKIVGQNWRAAFKHINEKSVDYIICDKSYIKPIIAIELDDKTHEKDDRKERDYEVERILKEAGLILLRFKNNGFFNREEIKESISEKLNITK